MDSQAIRKLLGSEDRRILYLRVRREPLLTGRRGYSVPAGWSVPLRRANHGPEPMPLGRRDRESDPVDGTFSLFEWLARAAPFSVNVLLGVEWRSVVRWSRKQMTSIWLLDTWSTQGAYLRKVQPGSCPPSLSNRTRLPEGPNR